MNDNDDSSVLDRLIAFDQQRPSVPGEHWLTFAAGLYLLLRPAQSAVGRLASTAAGVLLIGRALSGRDGALAWLQNQPQGSDGTRFVEVAAPWPYDHRVQISMPQRTRRRARTEAAPTTSV